MYLYGITKWGQPYVLDKIEGNVEISAEQHANIQSGDYTCETTITIGENSEGRYLRKNPPLHSVAK